MNRAPGKSDTWWARHEAECGGMYTKIHEPATTKKQLDAMTAKERAGRQKNKLDNWILGSAKTSARAEGDTSDWPIDVQRENKTSNPTDKKRKVSTLVQEDVVSATGQKRSRPRGDDKDLVVEKKTLVCCPICDESVAEAQINEHLDVVHLDAL
jgi:hypothetical protein